MGESPCLTCTSVKNPNICGNIECLRWKSWFLQKWDEIQIASGTKQEEPEQEPVLEVQSEVDYIVVGGRKYYHPDTLRAKREKEAEV